MRKIIISLDKKFDKEEKLVKGVLGKLDRILGLKGKYVEVYLVGNKFMEKNVLSFEAPKKFPRPDVKGYESLGEVYLNPDYIRKNGEDLAFMLVHGLLHLLGYDHKKERDRIKMEAKEKELMEKLRL